METTFITEGNFLISNYHVVKGAAKVRLLTGAGLIDAAVVKVDAANDLALLKAVGRFAPLPIAYRTTHANHSTLGAKENKRRKSFSAMNAS